MAKWANATVLDPGLNFVKANGTRLCVCSAQPANFVEANATYHLANNTLNAANYTGPANNGGSNNRQITVAQMANMTVATNGTANHIAIVDVTGTALLLVTTCTNQVLTVGNTVTCPAFNFQIPQPT